MTTPLAYNLEDIMLPRYCGQCGALMGDMSAMAYQAALRSCDDCLAELDHPNPER